MNYRKVLRDIAFLLSVSIVSLAVVAPSLAQSDKETLVVAVPSDIQNLDPTLSSADIYTQELLTNIYEWLIDYKVTDNSDGTHAASANEFQGALAEKFEWSPDKKKITFTLRKGLKFSDGDPIDANAVKFTYDRLYDQKGVTPFLLNMAAVPDKDHVKVVDPMTIEFDVVTPNSLLLGNVAQFGHSILNPKVIEAHMTDKDPAAHDWLKGHTGGTEQGPFKLESWQPGNQWVLARNDNYWGPKPTLKRIIFKVIPDASSRLAQLTSGAVDVAYELPTKDLKTLEGNKDVTVHKDTFRFVVYLGMNNKVKPFDNKLVRQAISYAIPYDTIINDVMNGYAIQLTSPIPKGTPTHTDAFFVYKNDPDKAKALLKQAGLPDGFKTTLQIPSGVEEGKETAVYVQQSLATIGVTVTIQEMPGAAFTEQLQKHALGFFFANAWISINNDPFYHLFWLFHSDCCDYANYKNPNLDAALAKYTLSTDVDDRNKAAVEAQKEIMDDAPWANLYQPEHILAMRSNVKGYVFYSSEGFTRYKYLYKE
jgi:peptide/nickel transport system substrate-binding protein